MKKFWNWQTVKNEAGEEERELLLEGVIAEESWWGDEITPAAFRDELNAGTGPITLHISSPGGDCIAASRIYTMLMDYPGSVFVQIDGLAASAASVIAMAGERVAMSPTAIMMIHNPWTVAMGDEGDMKDAIDVLKAVKESIMNAYQIKTGLSYEKLAKLMDDETWMDAKKARELGFADMILYAEGEEEEEEPEEDPDEEKPEDETSQPAAAVEAEGEDPEEDEDGDESEESEESEEERRPADLRLQLVAMADRMAVAALMNKIRTRPAAIVTTGTESAEPSEGGQEPEKPKKQPAKRRSKKAEDAAAHPSALHTAPEGAQSEEQRQRVASAFAKMNSEENRIMNIKNARGAFLKSAITRQPLAPEVRDALVITTGANPGNSVLPIEVSRSLITDIYGEDRFLSALTHTQIKGLRLPGVTASPASDAVREADGSTPAGATTLTDTVINFARYPGREKVTVPSAILRGTETDLDAYITGRLQYDHRLNMRKRIFAASSTTGDLAHMSVYTTGAGNPALTVVEGSDVLNAIQLAIADLPDGVRENAAVVMPYESWMALIQTLANGATTLFGKPTEEILGFKVITCDYVDADAGILVGDLSTIHINYDDPLWLKTDEDIDLDMTKIVIGYDYDIRIEDKNRLRLAVVDPN